MNQNNEIALVALAEMLKDLHSRMMPHEGQIPIGRAMFYEAYKKLFIECGRSFGKSRIAAYIAVRMARERPFTTNFIFGPFIGQMKEIYWTSRLLHDLIPEYKIESINNTEMRITLKNGSFIKVCGAENYEAYRGVKLRDGSIVILEELKDLRKEFLDAFLPNLSTSDPILMMIGTPPYRENHFTTYSEHAQKSPEWFYYNAPTRMNPFVSKEFLQQQKDFLFANGMEDVYFAEYEAKFTKGGHRSVFPMIAKTPIVKFEAPKDINKWHLYVAHDPASSSVWAVEFFLFNPFTKKVITCGEIYESDANKLSVRQIFIRTNEVIQHFKKLGVSQVNMTYDSAARWFRNEVAEIDENNEWWLIPCDKSGGLEGEIACIRGVAAHGHITFTDAAPKLKWELDNYVKDEKGRLPDKDDHAWQALAYGLKLAGFDFTETLEPKVLPDERRGFSLESELALYSMEELDGFG